MKRLEYPMNHEWLFASFVTSPAGWLIGCASRMSQPRNCRWATKTDAHLICGYFQICEECEDHIAIRESKAANAGGQEPGAALCARSPAP